ncbi:MAG: cysteine desulfurase family protein [bacterium]|nr:cysteine desulfurase family protein [bacterium]
MKRIYLDYAASTPVDPVVKKAMDPYFSKMYGNAGSLHSFGQEASAAVFRAREVIAQAIGANYRDIIFTGSATEANNLALRGAVKSVKYQMSGIKPRIIISSIEHESVLETCHDLEKEGVEIIYLPVSKDGIVDLVALKKALNDRTILVSIMYANNEIGTIQPISKIAEIVSDFRKPEVKNQPTNQLTNCPLLHTDAVQAFQYLDCNVQKLGVDLMTLSAHKIYGPKGIGCLYAPYRNNHYPLSPIVTGGGQQNGIHSGTENVPYIVGFAKAIELVVKNREKEAKRVKSLRDYFWQRLKKIASGITLNGSSEKRLPNNLNIYFAKQSAQDLLIKLDMVGVAVSPGSACRAQVASSSYVLEAMGLPTNLCSNSLRFTLGRPTIKVEIDTTIDKLKKICYPQNR